MEQVSVGSVDSSNAGRYNPFLDDVVKPFIDYGKAKKGSKSMRHKTAPEERAGKGGTDNPFHVTEESDVGEGGGAGTCDLTPEPAALGRGRGKWEEAGTGLSPRMGLDPPPAKKNRLFFC